MRISFVSLNLNFLSVFFVLFFERTFLFPHKSTVKKKIWYRLS